MNISTGLGRKILSAIDINRIDVAEVALFKKAVDEQAEWEQAKLEEEKRRAEAVPQVVPNFKSVDPGTIVVRSEHWKQDRCQPDNNQIGIITKLKVFEDDLCMAVYWPEVHWEGETFSSLVHPMLVALRSGEELPTITMNANQRRARQTWTKP